MTKAEELISLVDELDEAMWSGSIKAKWKAPEGFFTRSAKEIADGLRKSSKDLRQAMSRLSFFINRAGSNLSDVDRKRLEDAKAALRKAYA